MSRMNYYQNEGVRFWINFLIIATLLSVLGLGWVIKSLLFLLLFLFLLPIGAGIALQIWLKTRLVTAPCPVCGQVSTALKGQPFHCPSCGEPLEISRNQFVRLTPPGTIDVEVQTID
jgi:predicted RNA-binding Zn-ribbon protein involved in translation (DUF1610 family)